MDSISDNSNSDCGSCGGLCVDSLLIDTPLILDHTTQGHGEPSLVHRHTTVDEYTISTICPVASDGSHNACETQLFLCRDDGSTIRLTKTPSPCRRLEMARQHRALVRSVIEHVFRKRQRELGIRLSQAYSQPTP